MALFHSQTRHHIIKNYIELKEIPEYLTMKYEIGLQEMLRLKEKMLMDRLHQSFRRAESQLISILENRKGEVKVQYSFC